MSENKTRPGVMLYFDTLCPALARLSNEQSGRLLQGIICYAQTGDIPDFDGMVGLAFDLLRPGIDRDGERYEKQRKHGQYMAYCRAAKANREEPIPEEEWLLIVTNSNCQLPTTFPTPTTSSFSSTTSVSPPEGESTATGTITGSRLSPEEESRRRREMQRQILNYKPGGA